MFSFYAYPILMFRACLPVTLHCGLDVGIRTKHRSGKGHVNSVGLNCNRYMMFGVWGYCTFCSMSGSFPLPDTYFQPVPDSFSFIAFIASVQLPSVTFVVPSVVPA